MGVFAVPPGEEHAALEDLHEDGSEEPALGVPQRVHSVHLGGFEGGPLSEVLPSAQVEGVLSAEQSPERVEVRLRSALESRARA